MTGRELLNKKGTRYLFTQNGFRFYECGSRFFKVKDYNFDSKAIPVDTENNLKVC